jgi:hypothetical protein
LHIDCRWGVYEPATGKTNTHLVKCFNEDCVCPRQDDPISYRQHHENREELLLNVYHGLSSIAQLSPPTALKEPDAPCRWPGKVIRLDKLFRKRPNHPAVRYMEKRGFDPIQLGEEYGFVFCDTVEEQRCAMALGTILIPIWKDGELYSWISRYIGDEVNGVPISKSKIKKYYNCPGRSLSPIGYNLDIALQYSTVVIVEGVLDCIKTGPFATCLFTKTLSIPLKKQIVRGLSQYGDEATVVVMLDPDQDEKEKARGVPHHIERVASAFAEYIPNILRVYLPQGRDPGSMTQTEILHEIYQASELANIPVCFKKSKRNKRENEKENTDDNDSINDSITNNMAGAIKSGSRSHKDVTNTRSNSTLRRHPKRKKEQ